MKIGIGQINTTTGDFEGNFKKIADAAARLKEMGADFAVFPELALCGCFPKDKTFSRRFLERNADYLDALAEALPIPAFVGYARAGSGPAGAYNSLAWLEGGKVRAYYDKHLLPNYGIFEDPRNFDEGSGICVVEFMGRRIGLSICEDIWALDDRTSKFYEDVARPVDMLANENLDLLVNVSASLWSPENEAARARLLPRVARAVGAPLVYCNLVGGNDEMVCGGGSSVLNAGGDYCLLMEKFSEALSIAELDALEPAEAPEFERIPELYSALVMALGDFVKKSGFSKVLLGLSGGIDSALVATLAADALGPENVTGISLPSKFSSGHSKSDAKDLAENLGIRFETVSIEGVVEQAEAALSGIFAGLPRDVAEENMQARARGLLLMAVSNKFGSMLLSTGNKSECAVGYCTLYGDTCGGFAPISDVYKTDVFALSEYANRNGVRIPVNTITKPPSAELRPDQKDSDSLPEYADLDAVLRSYIEMRRPIRDIVADGFGRAMVEDVVRKFERSEYKRRQLAPGPRVSISSFGNGRRTALTDRKNYEF